MSIVTHALWFYRAFTRSLWMSMVVMVALANGLSAADGTSTGLAGSYFPNETLSGTPTVTRTDALVNFNWAGGAAAVGMPVDSFSVRWEGEIQPRYSESYKLIARTDDGVRMWLDGVLVVDAWKLRGAVDSTYVFTAVAGQHYRIRMEYYEHFGAAVAKLQWQSAHEAKAAIPTSQLYPLPADMTNMGSGSGLLASYFANETLSGTPVLTSTDARVDVDWAGGSPASGVPVDSFSARWDGEIQPRFTEVYTLIARTDDGVRVWLDNALVIDAWKLRGATDSVCTFTAQAGQRYRIRMEYFEHTGSASARLWWQSASELRGPIPTSQLYPTAPNLTGIGSGTGLIAAYFPNENLSGTPALNRTDARVDFDWAGGSPGTGVPVDSFSARWDGEIQPRFSESYTLTARTDDGVRLWIDNTLVIDAWKLRGATDSTYTFTAEAGRHYRIHMEYFEHTGSASARLWWQSASELRGPIATSQLYPVAPNLTGVGTGTGLAAAYFANETLSGAPMLTRTDARVDFDWAGGSPAAIFPKDSFSARWEGELQPRLNETYTLIARTDDGVKLWIDDVLVINAWFLRGAADSTYIFAAEAGRRYRVRMEYFEHGGSASARLWWQSASELRGPIATTQLYPTTISVIPTIAFAAASASVSERVGSTTATISLSAAAAQDVTIALQSSTSDAQVPPTITIIDGQTQAVVPVTILDDARYGADRSVTLSLSDPVGALLGTPVTQVLTIRNVDPKPTLTFIAPASMNLENSGTASIPLRLSAPSSGVTQVTLSLSGSAISGSDYSAPGALFEIPADTLDATIFVTLLPDILPEADEQLIITLSAPVGADLGAITTHAVTVSDGNQPPVIVSGPTPAVNPVTTNAMSLSVQATDDGGPQNLSYAWSVIGAAPAAVTFTPSTSATTTANFLAPGTYTIAVAVTDVHLMTASAQTTLIVISIPQLITVTPTTTTVSVRGTSTFIGHATDQFGTVLPISWSISGGGTIDTVGVFTAGDTAGGPFTITATSGTASATATITVINSAPLIVTPATASPNPVTGTSTALSVLGSDDGGEMNLTYTWSIIGTPPAPVTFSANTGNAAQNTTATFTASGSYTFLCTLTDVGQMTTTSNVTVVVTEASPVLSNTETSALAFIEGQAPTSLTATTVVTQAHNTAITQAVVQMTTNYQHSEDVLAFTPANGITGAWNASTGTLALSGSASAALYQAALRTIVYQNTSENPSTLPRTVTFHVTSTASLTSPLATRQITVAAVNDAPILAAIETTPLLVVIGAAATPVTSTITVSDVDNINLTQATVQIISGYQHGADFLSFTNANGISGAWSAGTMTLSGTATVANYQAALRTVKWRSTSGPPPSASLTSAPSSAKTSTANALATQSSSVGTRTVAFRAYDGAAWSTAATRAVSVGNTVAPLITTQPVNQSVNVGQTATFTVVATGTPTPTYQWRKNSVNISGATSASYTTPPTVISDQAAIFSVLVTNIVASVPSANATLTVNTTPTVTTTAIINITATGAASGGTVTLDGGVAVTARGLCWATSENPTTANSVSTDGIGLGTFTSALSNLSPGTTYHVRAYATNSVGTSYGVNANFTTLSAAIAPVITTQPAHQTVLVGQTATFRVVATGTPTPTYQWRKNGENISGATSALYTTPTTVIGDNAAQFSVLVTNIADAVASANALLTVNAFPAVATPVFTPASGSSISSVTVTANCATNGAVIRYTADGSDPTNISPTFPPSLLLTSTTTLKAMAFAGGLDPSPMVSKTYTITAPTPSFTVTPATAVVWALAARRRWRPQPMTARPQRQRGRFRAAAASPAPAYFRRRPSAVRSP